MDFQPNTGDGQAVPPLTILFILIVAVFFGSLVGSGFVFALSTARGVDLQQLLGTLDADSPLSTRNFVRLANLISHVFTFTIPSLVVAFVFFRRRWISFLQLDRPPQGRNILLSAFFILAAFPIAQTTYWINQQLPIPEWARQMETSATGMLKSLLVMESPQELLFNLLVVAVLPAIGEELLFRGMIQRNLERLSGRPHLAVWLAGAIFSAIHLQFEGFIPRLILGVALGYLFYWTRNLWVPIAAHFVFNGMQVVAQYALSDKIESLDLEEVRDPQWGAFAFGLVLLFGIGYYIRKNSGEAPSDSSP
jgi:membrane protease YdiL (CAAX protease family)